ncbi:hypothetical protein [Burkholderia cenocepacia]|uniref:Uncharacterized protein n=1 Tax=Burkholderia cenocepacia TaxID=95486 RepID=A0A3S9NJ61_9BURK|nr:hypothetical protein [Burkholderia cenocepacia]AZQ55700.1 hypothetical protein D5R55_33335 [Burkholderia cenocepacia]
MGSLLGLVFGEQRFSVVRFLAVEGRVAGNQSPDDCRSAHQGGALGEAVNLSVYRRFLNKLKAF